MSENIPVLPIAGGALTRAFLALLALVTRWLKEIARARRHRREAAALAGLDRHMLADIGLNRSDLNDAFSGPLWEDPTVLLGERAGERRRNRPSSRMGEAPVSPIRGRLLAARAPPRAADALSHSTHSGRSLSSVARSDTRDHPLSRPDPAPAGPSRRAHF